jgi:hypothetical protein
MNIYDIIYTIKYIKMEIPLKSEGYLKFDGVSPG